MKTTTLLLAALAALTPGLFAQTSNPSGEESGARKGPPPPPRIVRTLDANRDRVISAEEIANAASALRTLDANGDGLISRPEMGPPPPPKKSEVKAKAKAREEGKPTSRRPPPKDPLVAALDADQNKSLSAEEVTNAPTALAKLDRNGDGQLTQDEFAPPPPRRQRHGSKPDASPSPSPTE